MRTGVIQPLPGIGDMVWYLPALKAIAAAAPDGKITLFTRASAQARSVLKAEPMIAAIVDLPAKKRGMATVLPNLFQTWLALFKSRPDRLFILHSSLRYRLAARLAGIREIIAYPASLSQFKEDEWSKSRAFIQEQGIAIPNIHSSLAVAPETVTTIGQRFHSNPQPWIIIAPGASVLFRTWPVERFAFCADALLEETGGTIFLVGSQREEGHIAAVQKACRNGAKMIPIVGLPFDQVMGLIASSSCLLGNDSGPANVAAALGLPTFSLCGTHTPVRHSPYLHFITPDLSNGKMSREGINEISAAHVLESMRTVLGAVLGQKERAAKAALS